MIEASLMGHAAPTMGVRTPHLTPTERRLLDTLKGRRTQIISRAELVLRVLEDAMASERTIDVHIRALRRKLGPALPIRTYRGRGYAWVG